MFKDEKLMTAREKDLILKSWKTFLKHGLKKQHFTERLYEHLYLHCRFIGHFDIGGFYSAYFKAGPDIHRFFRKFLNDRTIFKGSYGDLHKAMRRVYFQYKAKIIAQINKDITNKLNMLEASVLKARKDLAFARDFLSRLYSPRWYSLLPG